MATIYSAPDGFEPPRWEQNISWKEMEEKEAHYIVKLAAYARKQLRAPDPIIGKVVRFPFADGYAQYMVWKLRPLELVHLDLGDGWNIPAAHARGLKVSDIREMVGREEAWSLLFSKKKEA